MSAETAPPGGGDHPCLGARSEPTIAPADGAAQYGRPPGLPRSPNDVSHGTPVALTWLSVIHREVLR
jgi:hypothetical protein